jgi:hypothetical protein
MRATNSEHLKRLGVAKNTRAPGDVSQMVVRHQTLAGHHCGKVVAGQRQDLGSLYLGPGGCLRLPQLREQPNFFCVSAFAFPSILKPCPQRSRKSTV